MRIEAIAIGTELLTTRRTDTNSVWIGERLAMLGLAFQRKTCVGDDPDLRAVEDAMHQLRQMDLGGPPAGLRQAAALTGAVAEATRRLHERARRAAKG